MLSILMYCHHVHGPYLGNFPTESCGDWRFAEIPCHITLGGLGKLRVTFGMDFAKTWPMYTYTSLRGSICTLGVPFHERDGPVLGKDI